MAKKVFNPDFINGALNSASQNENKFFEMINIYDIIPNEKNEFSIDDESIEDLALNIKQLGLQQNLVVRRDGSSYKLISGHRRLLALKKLVMQGEKQFESVYCNMIQTNNIDLPLSDEQKELFALISGNEYRELTDSDKLFKVKELQKIYDELKRGGFEVPKTRRGFVAESLGISDGAAAKFEYVAKNQPVDVVTEALTDGNINIHQANKIAHQPKDKQEEVLKRLTSLAEKGVIDEPVDELMKEYVKMEEAEDEEELIPFTPRETELIMLKGIIRDLNSAIVLYSPMVDEAEKLAADEQLKKAVKAIKKAGKILGCKI